MKRPSLHNVLLWGASWLVPFQQREDWLAEWRAEVSYVPRRTRYSQAQFCLGAVWDAIWLRRHDPAPVRREGLLQSPRRCLLALAATAAGALLLAFVLPGARDLHPAPESGGDTFVMLGVRQRFATKLPSVPVALYAALRDGGHGRLSGLSYYRPVRTSLECPDGTAAGLTIAVTSHNLFDLLRIRIDLPDSEQNSSARARVVVHERVWRKHLGGNPAAIGQRVRVNGEDAVIAAVLPRGSWRLPGRVDAWLLKGPEALSQMPEPSAGFVIGALRASTPHSQKDLRWHVSVAGGSGAYKVLHGAVLSEHDVLRAHLFLLLLALLILPLVTPIESSQIPSRMSAGYLLRNVRQWAFLLAKALVLIAIVFLGVQDLASVLALPIQPHGLLLGYVLALRWAFLDQRQRCPECLRRVAHPAQIGSTSHTFLEWYGQELACPKGHGLLYVPEIAASSNGRRWQGLDSTWAGLFAVRQR